MHFSRNSPQKGLFSGKNGLKPFLWVYKIRKN